MGSGGGSSSKQTSSASPQETEALQAAIDWAKPYLESTTAGAKYPGELYTDTPELFNQAYSQYSGGQYNDLNNQVMRDLISGKPAYEFDPAATTARWQETYANPIMDTWRETIAPTLRESMNLPGTYYGRNTSDYLSQQAGEFYGGRVAPTLYNTLMAGEALGAQSAENARAGQFNALSLPYQQFGQQASAAQTFQQQQERPLAIEYQEYLRQDPFKYAQLLAGIQGTPTVTTTQSSGGPGIGATIGMAAGMALSGGLGSGALTATGLSAGAAGGALGSAF